MAAQTEESDTAREQTKAEQDVDQVRQRAVRDQQRLDSGAVTSPKDLENLQREITSLAKRQGDLEDVVLEVMERRESAQERVAELTERVASVQSKIDDATARRDAATESLDGEAATATKEREVIVGTIPADLLKLYDKLRDQQGGVGAAKLYQRSLPGLPAGAGDHRDQRDPRGGTRHGGALRELPPHPGAHVRVRPVAAAASDLGKGRTACGSSSSRPTAGHGATRDPRATDAVVLDAVTGETLAEAAEYIGTPRTTWPSTGD